ncbi:hypothetical protein, partial [Klebsiella variicola]|uniref:hypothetical protein n=1 Tax=Klebsiella variicola TaxID=244366 RepID=UPI002731D02B
MSKKLAVALQLETKGPSGAGRTERQFKIKHTCVLSSVIVMILASGCMDGGSGPSEPDTHG